MAGEMNVDWEAKRSEGESSACGKGERDRPNAPQRARTQDAQLAIDVGSVQLEKAVAMGVVVGRGTELVGFVDGCAEESRARWG